VKTFALEPYEESAWQQISIIQSSILQCVHHRTRFIYAHEPASTARVAVPSKNGNSISRLPVSASSLEPEMTWSCPLCGSPRIATRDLGRKGAGVIGGIAGALAGMSTAVASAEVGAVAGAAGGPVGVIAGLIIGGLAGSASGFAAGARVGEVIDGTVLDNFQCADCAATFSIRHRT